ncbi:glycosyltransferase family 2 protein [Methyloversatilis sp. XJ19-13]|uniref:glycosyltransferase family 2 protein n=1 Tax=Methyloversatilis sp. XJ19-13 TaxID=2963430 RepID=UPI00211B9CDA|nr:glycosyltransferase family 2 protein [Methyloversatilis sp. XJ19-13]MCQ9373883.1 glycosyltransferase family 2 protein [Methyloversatilis sp. XJ19-13]
MHPVQSSSLSIHSFPKVAIFLCTYQGQNYLAEQLESLAAQTHSNWEVWASDDGSEDDTLTILDAYRRLWGPNRLSIHSGPARGFVVNFLHSTCSAALEADYYAYSDQDDIWEADKLERAIIWLRDVPQDVPALYCSRTRLIDEKNTDIGFSPRFAKPPSFANALMQNIGGGNTMLFNNAARTLLQQAGEDIQVVTHDWWVYLAVSGCGGQVLYDTYPSLRYRQHSGNLIGMNAGWAARWARICRRCRGDSRLWNDVHIKALTRIRDRMTPENIRILDCFSSSRNLNVIARIVGLWRSGVHRQTLLGNLGLIAEVLFGKI